MADAARALMLRKNGDYADPENSDVFGNLDACEHLGICTTEQGILIRMLDKTKRLVSSTSRDYAVADETVTDTLLDLINYAVLFEAKRRARQGNPPVNFISNQPLSPTGFVLDLSEEERKALKTLTDQDGEQYLGRAEKTTSPRHTFYTVEVSPDHFAVYKYKVGQFPDTLVSGGYSTREEAEAAAETFAEQEAQNDAGA